MKVWFITKSWQIFFNKIHYIIPIIHNITTYQYQIFDPTIETKKKIKIIQPKYKIGDEVNVLLQEPVNALGKKHSDNRFRMADYRLDKKKRKVLAVYCYSGIPSYRYAIQGLPNASYTEQELKQV